MARQTQLQAVRGAAVLLVLLQHVTAVMQERTGYVFAWGAFGFGFSGVDLFFVLSGYIIYRVYRADLGQPGRAGPFVIGRLTRILPLVWLVTTAKLVLLLVQPGLSRPDRAPWGVIISSYLLLPLPVPDVYPIIGVAWTLSHEVVFYGLFVLGVLFGRRIFVGALGAWSAVSIVANLALGRAGLLEFGTLARFMLYERNIHFLLGCAGAAAAAVLPAGHPIKRWAAQLAWLGVAWFVASAVYEFAFGHDHASLVVLYGLPSLLIVFGLGEQQPAGAPKVRTWGLAALGDASYSIYLTHFLVLDAVPAVLRFTRLADAVPPLVLSVLLITVATVVGLATYRWIEIPMIAASRALARRLTARPVPRAP